MSKHVALVMALAAAAPAVAWGAEPAPQPSQQGAAPAKPEIAPDADKLLRQMTDYLASLKKFRLTSYTVDEVVTKAGQKIQIVTESVTSVERPNRLRSEQIGGPGLLSYWYDGKDMTLYCKANNTYGTVPAKPSLDQTIDLARKQYQIEAPGADLLFSRPYDILTEQVKSGQFLGRETIGGVTTDHLAFVGEDVDWQIWIKEGGEPLPVRFVISTKTMKEQPEFTLQVSHWEPQVKLAETTFAFTPPPGATRTQTLPTSCGKP